MRNDSSIVYHANGCFRRSLNPQVFGAQLQDHVQLHLLHPFSPTWTLCKSACRLLFSSSPLYMKLCFIIYRAFGFVNCFSGRCLTLFSSQMPGTFFSGGCLFYRQVHRHFFTPMHSFSLWFETAHPLNGVPPDKKRRLTGLFPADGFSAPFF